ncbi:MAG: acyl-CoA thioester hydrolase [Gammaproteobacteria bacterium]|jgi:acyl-CoA thioester hydrolase
MKQWTETCRGVVYPWHCDHLGHMNVQHYVGFFDIGAFHFLSVLGFGSHNMHDIGATFVDAQHTVRYINEQPPGSLIKVESAVTKIGNKSATVLHRMTNTETDLVAATSEITLVYFDLKARTSMAIPDDLRARMQPYLVDASELG